MSRSSNCNNQKWQAITHDSTSQRRFPERNDYHSGLQEMRAGCQHGRGRQCRSGKATMLQRAQSFRTYDLDRPIKERLRPSPKRSRAGSVHEWMPKRRSKITRRMALVACRSAAKTLSLSANPALKRAQSFTLPIREAPVSVLVSSTRWWVKCAPCPVCQVRKLPSEWILILKRTYWWDCSRRFSSSRNGKNVIPSGSLRGIFFGGTPGFLLPAVVEMTNRELLRLGDREIRFAICNSQIYKPLNRQISNLCLLLL